MTNPNESIISGDDDLRRALRETAVRALRTQRQSQPFDPLIDQILGGRNSDDGGVFHLPSDWKVKLDQRLEVAGRRGEADLLRKIQTIETTLTSLAGDTPINRSAALAILATCGTEPMSCWVAGTLGLAAATGGDLSLAAELTRLAMEKAKFHGLQKEECDWSSNLGSLLAQNDPAAGEKQLLHALSVAKAIRNERREGRLLNNLALVYAKHQRLAEATKLQLEALRIARRMEDEGIQAQRAAFMAELLEATGQRDSSIQHFSEAVQAFSQMGDLKTSKQIVDHLIAIVIDPLEAETSSILGERLKKAELTVDAIRAIMERSRKDDKVITYSSESKVTFTPDTSFAHSLCDRQEWKALAVYAKHWAQQTEFSGNGQGYHWLAVALTKLGYPGFATACLEWGLRLPLAFAGWHHKSE
ncbi:MAG: tetratricopeptide repeat protein [Pirellulaceae bacterium]